MRIARVCQTWYNIAASLIWKRLPDAQALFRLLAPLLITEDLRVVFFRPLTSQDWVRFDSYARRVRELHQLETCAQALHPALMMEVLVTRRPSEILPRLRHLHLHPCTLDSASLFLHSTLTSLTISHAEKCPLLGALLSSLPTKTPGLANFSLHADVTHAPAAEVEKSLAEALSKLPSLTSLHLPPWWVTPAIADTAASCPNLRDFLSSYTVAEWMTLDESAGFRSMMSTSLPADSFPSLTNLTIPMPFPRATKVLLQGDYFSKLTRFQVASPWIESPGAYRALLATLSTRCPNLEILSLTMSPVYPPTHDFAAITFEDLKPVTRLSGLQYLYLHYPRPLQITAEDVVAIARTLPSIAVLSLNPTPNIDDVSPLGVGVISPLLALCPKLYDLKLYMNTADEHIPPPPSDEASRRAAAASAELTGLETLDAGSSSVSSPIAVAIFLSRVLPSRCSVDASERGVDAWAEVSRLIPAFRQVRAEGS